MAKRVTDIGKSLRTARILIHLIRNRTRSFTPAEILEFIQATDSVSLRNIQRDLKDLADNQPHTCVMQTRRNGKIAYCMEPDFAASFGVPIERNGLVALFLLKQIQPFFAPGARTLEEVGKAIAKMGEDAGYELFEDLDDELRGKIYAMGDQSTLRFSDAVLNSVLTALAGRRKLKVVYSRGGEDTFADKTVCPAKLVLSKGELYLICMSEYNEVWDFYLKMNRIYRVELLEETFTANPARIARIEKRLSDSFGILDANVPDPKKVELRFPGYLEKVFREKKFHRTQMVTRNKKGETVVTMTVPIGVDFVRWVLGWGEDVTVVGPKELRKQLQEMGAALARKYGQ